MAEQIIRDDARVMRRRLHAAVGKSIFKTLAEPITNSDDSYRRGVQDGLMDAAVRHPIFIIVDKKTNKRPKISVVDWAEAMTDKEMGNLFEVYGQEKSGLSEGKKVRGLFGQGITDVLLFHKHGNIKSIKDKNLYECKFYVKDNGDRAFDPRQSRTRVEENLRKSLHIPEGNGTVVSFELADSVPWPTKVTEKMERFSMLRLINSDENREVHYIERKNGKIIVDQVLNYNFPTGDEVVSWDGVMEFEEFEPLKLELEVKQANGELPSDENGILVFDEENAVYALTMFGLEAIPGHDQLFGKLRITGAREIIRTKLNQKEGTEAILSDDREGFNQSTTFYKKLSELIQQQVRPFLLEQNKKAVNDKSVEDLTKNEKEVFDVFNQVFNEIVSHDKPLLISNNKKLEPPSNGLAFDRSDIKTTIDRDYGLGLSINTSLLPVGSKVEIQSDAASISVLPTEFIVTKDLVVDGDLSRKHIFITGSISDEVGLVTAQSGGYTTQLLVEVKPEVFVYPDTMVFEPEEASVTMQQSYKAKLYINTNKIPIGSKLTFSQEGTTTQVPEQVILTDEDIQYEEVALVVIPLTVETEGHVVITANSGEFSTTLRMISRQPNQPPPPVPNASIKGWDFINLPEQWYVCFYDPMPESSRHGYLLVNIGHPLNKHYFGESPTKDSVRESKTAMTYLCEILTNEMLDVAYKEKLQEDRTSGGDPFTSDSHAYVKKYIGEKKREIGPLIHSKWLG